MKHTDHRSKKKGRWLHTVVNYHDADYWFSRFQRADKRAKKWKGKYEIERLEWDLLREISNANHKGFKEAEQKWKKAWAGYTVATVIYVLGFLIAVYLLG
jgi:hypothetical protein